MAGNRHESRGRSCNLPNPICRHFVASKPRSNRRQVVQSPEDDTDSRLACRIGKKEAGQCIGEGRICQQLRDLTPHIVAKICSRISNFSTQSLASINDRHDVFQIVTPEKISTSAPLERFELRRYKQRWRDDARGLIIGLTAYANQGHIARAALEATAWQSREVVDAANDVADVPFTDLRVDGGMTANELLMQFQADVLGVPVIRPAVTETTALGAAYAAGLAVGFWSGQDELRERWSEDKRWEPQMDKDVVQAEYARWLKAVERSLNWEE